MPGEPNPARAEDLVKLDNNGPSDRHEAEIQAQQNQFELVPDADKSEADDMAKEIIDWGKSGFINIVGGCCGTTPEHIRAFAKGLEGVKPRALPELDVRMRLSGLEACNLN